MSDKRAWKATSNRDGHERAAHGLEKLDAVHPSNIKMSHEPPHPLVDLLEGVRPPERKSSLDAPSDKWRQQLFKVEEEEELTVSVCLA